MSSTIFSNGGYITKNKPTLSRPRDTGTSLSFSPGWNSGLDTIVDRGVNNISVTNNSVIYDSSTPLTGTNRGSMYFNANTDYIQATSSEFTFGTGDFTIMGWFYFTNFGTYSTLFEGSTTGGGRENSLYWYINPNDPILQIYKNGNLLSGGAQISLNEWYHLALIRASGTTRTFVDGVFQTSTTAVADVTTNFCKVGIEGPNNDVGFTGYVANYFVIKGIALHTSSFTPESVDEQLTQVGGLENTTVYGVYKL